MIGRQVGLGDEVIESGRRVAWYGPSGYSYGTVSRTLVREPGDRSDLLVDWDDGSRSSVPTWSARLRIWDKER